MYHESLRALNRRARGLLSRNTVRLRIVTGRDLTLDMLAGLDAGSIDLPAQHVSVVVDREVPLGAIESSFAINQVWRRVRASLREAGTSLARLAAD